MFRKTERGLEVLLAHPGGPYFNNKDDGVWTIPKGQVEGEESLPDRARIEFEEELGFVPSGALIDLGCVRQKGGKTVYAWAVQGDPGADFVARSNTFEMEWPPHSGNRQLFPEVDRAAFFSEADARRKINPAQIAFIDRLREMMEGGTK